MTTTDPELRPGSRLLWVLAHVCNRDEAGKHFTEVWPDGEIEALEGAGLVEVDRPVHEATGYPYNQPYWTIRVTEEGVRLTEDLYDERDYNEDGSESDV